MIKLPIVDRVKFVVERQFARGAGFQLLVVAAVIGLISLFGGIAVRFLGEGESLPDAIWWAFLRLTDPGYLGDDEGTWRRIVSTVLTVSGYVVFLGALVAIMTQWLIARMREFERGLTPVAFENHVVIIGWTNRTVPLLRELLGNLRSRRRFLEAFGARKLKTVVLAEQAPSVLVQTLRADPLIGRKAGRKPAREAGRVIFRYGSPLEEEAIQRAACLNAATVIMPGEFGGAGELVSPDVQAIRSLLSMDARAAVYGQKLPLVIAEIRDARRIDMVRKAYRGPLEIVPSDDTVSRLLAQNLFHAGLSAFYREVLTARSGNEIFLRPAARLAGARLTEVASQYSRGVVLGLLQRQGEKWVPVLNAPSSQRLARDDQLVILARSLADAEPVTRGRLSPVERRPARGSGRPSPVRAGGRSRHYRILMLGWSQRVPNLFSELASYSDSDFEVDLVSVADARMREREIERYSPACARVATRHIETDFLLAGEMEKFDLSGYSAIFLLSSDRLDSAEEADARAVVGQRIIEDLLEGLSRRPQILLELADSANEGLVRATNAETLVSPLVISHLLAQVALQREIGVVFDELFTVGGAELEFRTAAEYRVRKSMTFAALEAAVAERGETLLGVQRQNQDRASLQSSEKAARQAFPESPRLRLNPPRDEVFELVPADRLLVLTSVQP